MKFYLIVIFFLAAACNKEENEVAKSRTVLLTEKPWRLAGYGLDENGNRRIDLDEEAIEECQKDNTSQFRVDGSGSHYDNAISCGNGITEQPFTWKFIENERALDFLYTTARIERLNESELIISYDSGPAARFLTVFHH
ncbi:MAG TPA: hypothetical protein VFX58_05135 [Chitinophagaceae bacterium]|nr:hypothetical protein [Chitinophagaceae bacterium]